MEAASPRPQLPDPSRDLAPLFEAARRRALDLIQVQASGDPLVFVNRMPLESLGIYADLVKLEALVMEKLP